MPADIKPVMPVYHGSRLYGSMGLRASVGAAEHQGGGAKETCTSTLEFGTPRARPVGLATFFPVEFPARRARPGVDTGRTRFRVNLGSGARSRDICQYAGWASPGSVHRRRWRPAGRSCWQEVRRMLSSERRQSGRYAGPSEKYPVAPENSQRRLRDDMLDRRHPCTPASNAIGKSSAAVDFAKSRRLPGSRLMLGNRE